MKTKQPALLFDIGNTRLKWGLATNGEVTRSGYVTHEKIRDLGFTPLTAKLPQRVSQILVSNVAGAGFGSRFAAVMSIHCNADVHFVHSEKQAFGVTNAYARPRNLGVDRWVAMVGARAEFSGAVCVVDAGTAVTIDLLDRSGMHKGGQIIPGVELMRKALDTSASDINVAKSRASVPVEGIGLFGRNTRQAIDCGAFAAVCGAINGAARAARGAGFRPRIVLTGGDASRILKLLDGHVTYRPDLVLQGLAFMLRNKS